MGATECKGCSAADPTTDTVKVNIPGAGATLLSDADSGKALIKQGADEQRKAEEVAELARREAAKQAELKVQEERKRREEEEQARKEQEAKAQEEQRLREETEKEAEVARLAAREAEEKLVAEEAARKAEADAQTKATEISNAFLKAKGFKKVSQPKTSFMKTTYPLHVAVTDLNAEAVSALLRCGADKTVKNSAGKTAKELAEKLNKKGSHDAIITILQ